MYKNILENISRHVQLNEDEKKLYTSKLNYQRVKKRQYLSQPGFTCNTEYYVIKGCLRSFYLDNDGNEHTLQLAVNDWWITDFTSFSSQTPATLFVQAIEDSELLGLDFKSLEEVFVEVPKFERFTRLMVERSHGHLQRRLLSTMGKTAEDRYLSFIEEYPDIVNRIPQYVLASYLGISREFLSKIRKKLIVM